MKLNNKGVTLVELVVTMAVLGIVTVAIQGFIRTSAKINANVIPNVKMQYESQIVMANVQKHLINANKNVFFEDGRLLMISENDNEEDVASFLVFNETDNSLYYGENTVQAGRRTTVNVYKLAENITDFTIDFTESVDDGVTKGTQADIILKMDRNGKEYEGEMSVSLRNKPAISNNSRIDYRISQ